MTIIYQTRTIGGKVYPKARRKGENVAYAFESHREGSKVVSTYIGIREVPESAEVQERDSKKGKTK